MLATYSLVCKGEGICGEASCYSYNIGPEGLELFECNEFGAS